jgi:dTDP-4-amino-4,6-dideoxygalactose transaminase
LVVTSDDGLAARARLLRNHGAEQQYFHKLIGGNFRIDGLQAAFLNVKLPHLAGYTARRRQHAAFYNGALAKLNGRALDLPFELRDNRHIWNQYTVRVRSNRRDALRHFLFEQGIGSGVYYPVPLHRQECFVTADTPSLPVAEQLSRECLSLPVYPELTGDQLSRVSDTVAAFFAKQCPI